MARLPVVLGTDDLPIAELCAARLDGELFAVDDGWAPVDEPDLPAFRAAVVALRAPRRLVVERLSAAWVHGGLATPPAIAQFCVPLSARIAVIGDHRATVREVRIEDSEIIELGGIRCTSIVRTGFDLLREPSFEAALVEQVVGAMIAARSTLGCELRERLDAATRMPHKSAAFARLDRAEASAARSADDSFSRR
ncbi:hypothetical protein ACFWN7_01205 [Agromyces sp. NPDC058484]|uniref:hypothetical protein n=1 Tax=Agromyces sp. NPDC058484 TaxID=3346524 RepID=UPI00364F14CA